MSLTREAALLTALLSAAAAVAAIVFGILGARRGSRRDDAGNVEKTTTFLVEIGHIKAGIDTINSRLEEMRRENAGLKLSLTRLECRLDGTESGLRAASRRIDELGARITAAPAAYGSKEQTKGE